RRARASSTRRRFGKRRRKAGRRFPARRARSRLALRRRTRAGPPLRRSASAPGREPPGQLRLTVVAETLSGRARELFAPLGPTYDRYARLLSFGQDPRWRRFLVSRLPGGPAGPVLAIP